jgi:hypothetical protein
VVVAVAIIGAALSAHLLVSRETARAGEQVSSIDGARYRVDVADARRVGARTLTAQDRARSLTFAPDVSESDRQLILNAIARSRPEARRLIDVVDGLVVVHVGRTPAGAAGTTQARADDYELVLDLGTAMRRFGERGVARLVLHELGHVVDFAIVPTAVERTLDAQTPQGYGCEEGMLGGCTSVPERFAESFAKWATNDIGVDLDLGYKVPPPSSLDDWGLPLVALAG